MSPLSRSPREPRDRRAPPASARAEEGGATALRRRLAIPEDLPFLEGHFPGRPLVAGVVQVHLVMGAVEEILGRSPRLESLERLRFREVLLPGQDVLLQLELEREPASAAAARFAFSLADAADPERVFCSGRGRLAGARSGAS